MRYWRLQIMLSVGDMTEVRECAPVILEGYQQARWHGCGHGQRLCEQSALTGRGEDVGEQPSSRRVLRPWSRDNIDALVSRLGLNVDGVNSEEQVGRYTVDLWAQEEKPRSRGIVIENQLTMSDHDHLGKLQTYGAGLGAEIIIWVAPEFRDEHLEAIRWLNEPNEGKSYFAVQLEVLKISGSPPAPLFRVLVQPKDWAATRSPVRTEPSPRMIAYKGFFEGFLNDLKLASPSFTITAKARHDSYLTFSAGRTGFQLGGSFNRGRRFRAELYIDKGDKDSNKAAFDALFSQKDEIENELGVSLRWERLDEARACRIADYNSGSIDDAQEVLAELTDWAVGAVIRLKNTFGPRIAKL